MLSRILGSSIVEASIRPSGNTVFTTVISCDVIGMVGRGVSLGLFEVVSIFENNDSV